MHTRQVPTQTIAIYAEATKTYLQALVPFARFAWLVALVVNIFVLLPPSDLIRNVSWSVLVNFFSVTMLASTAVLPMAIELRSNGVTSASTGIRGIRQHGVRFLLATAPFAIFNGLLVLSWIGIALAVFLTVRFSLFGPAIVLEESDVTDSYARSWELISKLWVRTAAILLCALVPFAIFATVLAALGSPSTLTFFLLTFVEGLVAPFVAIVVLLLFEDYRRIKEDQSTDSRERPPSEGL